MRSHALVANASVLILSVAGALACGESDGVDPCQQAPTFSRDVLPISLAKCATCHAPGVDRQGAPLDLNFHDWPSVEPVVEEFADALTSRRQPPLGSDPVTDEELELVSRWRRCGFRE